MQAAGHGLQPETVSFMVTSATALDGSEAFSIPSIARASRTQSLSFCNQ